MKTYKILIGLVLTSFLISCGKETPFIEDNPTTEIIQIQGHEFFMRGTIDGEPILFEHISSQAYNSPINDDDASSTRPFFGTIFTKDNEEGYSQYFDLRITANEEDRLADILKVGSYDWYDFSFPSDSRREAHINQLNWGGEDYLSLLTPNSVGFNEFNITSVEQVEIDDNLSDYYHNHVYKVTGNFKANLFIWDNNPDNDTTKLVIDEFSALFFDKIP